MKISNNVLLFCLAAFAPSSVTAAPATCGGEVDGATPWEGNGHYYKFVDGPLAWSDAKAAAETLSISICGVDVEIHGHLAAVTSEAENNFVYTLFPPSGYKTTPSGLGPWLGGFQPAGTDETSTNANDWEWVTGEDWDYVNWLSGEPNNNSGQGDDNEEDCLGFRYIAISENGGKRNDGPCGFKLPYFVEFSGPTLHVGKCDTGIVDPTYNLCECTSTAAEDMLDCATPECVAEVGLAAGLSEGAIAAIVETCRCELPCPDPEPCGNFKAAKLKVCHEGGEGPKELCIAAPAWPAHCRNHGDSCGSCD